MLFVVLMLEVDCWLVGGFELAVGFELVLVLFVSLTLGVGCYLLVLCWMLGAVGCSDFLPL